MPHSAWRIFVKVKLMKLVRVSQRAVDANSQNYLAHYYYAFTLSRQSLDGQRVSAYTPEVSAKMKNHLQQAIKLRPDYLESYNLLAFVSLVTGEGLTEAVDSMKQALKVAPGREDFSFTLAQLYARMGEYKTSRQILEQLAKSTSADDYLRQNSAVVVEATAINRRPRRHLRST